MSFLTLGRIYQLNPALVSDNFHLFLSLSLFQLTDFGRKRVKLSKCLSFKVSDLLLWNKGLPDGRRGELPRFGAKIRPASSALIGSE